MRNIFEGTVIFELFDKLKKLKQGRIFVEIIKEKRTKDLIIKLNTDQMRLDFVNSKGDLLSDVGGDYSPYTVDKGNKKNEQSVDLYDSGKFHKSFRVKRITQTGFFIDSDPIKDDGTNLLEEWGEDIEGLNFKSLEELRAYIMPLFIDKILQQL